MVKQLLSTIVFTSVVFLAAAQPSNRQYDSLIRRIVERNIDNHACDSCAQTGACVIEVSKTDSITVRLLYTSDRHFDLSRNEYFVKRLKEKGNEFIKEIYTVIVPVYFYYQGEKPSPDVIASAEAKIKHGKQGNIMPPVICVTYEVQHKKKSNEQQAVR